MTRTDPDNDQTEEIEASFPPEEEIQAQLEKILTSPEFHATKQQRDFLNHVILETLAGRSGNLKGYAIATQVFGRSAEFDPSIDPIVSIQANKLRRALERYYLVDGRRDQLRIDIPKGAYTPTFASREGATGQQRTTLAHPDPAVDEIWPTILIQPFRNMTGEAEQDFLGTGIATELAIEISKHDNVRVLFARDGIISHNKSNTANSPRFILNGELYGKWNNLEIDIFLVDAKTNIQLWGTTYRMGTDIDENTNIKDHVVQTVAIKVCGEFGIIPRTLSREIKSTYPREVSSYEAMLKFWEYEQNMTPNTFKQALEALLHAVTVEPDYCQTWGSLAILFSTIYNLEIEGFENPLDKAVQYAEKASIINPNNQRIVAINALVRFSSNELPAAIQEAHRAYQLNPRSLFVLDGIAWIMTLSGDWENGPRLAEKAIRLNPYHRAVTHDALWVDYLRRQKYDLAYLEACNRHRPNSLFWDPLIKAATLGLVGKPEEGKKYIEKLITLRPDVHLKGKKLITNYIKFDEIAERTLYGLRKSGLNLTLPAG